MEDRMKKEIEELLGNKGIESDEAPKNLIQTLGIDRPDEWVEKANEVCKGFYEDNTDALDIATKALVIGTNPLAFLKMMADDSLRETSVHIAQLFLVLGYMKGLSEGEDSCKTTE